MNIVVLNGSPKGLTSVTVQYVRFLQKKLPEHTFAIHNIASDLRHLEDRPEAFQSLIAAIAAGDGVLWAFPLYVLLVHAHYKRFIELIEERGAQGAFRGKHAAALTTSIRFFDHTAHNYIHAVSEDWQMHYWGGFSAEMYDLLKPEERRRLLRFAEDFLAAITARTIPPRCHAPIQNRRREYVSGVPPVRLDAHSKQVLIVTDAADHQANLQRMIERFRANFAVPPEVINLHAVNIRGGCLGCIQCGLDNACVYRDADDVYAVYRRLMTADVLVFAGAIRDRYLSSRWKLFFDRGFFNNHVPMFVGKQLGYLISGPLAQIPNLRQILEAYTELQQANLAGIVSDECLDGAEFDRVLDGLAHRLVACAQTGYIAPPTFLGVAGRKLFRDEIWASLRFVFHADHRYYKRHGLYDFPKRSLKTRLTNAVVQLLVRIPRFRKEFLKRIKSEMVKPLEKLLDKE